MGGSQRTQGRLQPEGLLGQKHIPCQRPQGLLATQHWVTVRTSRKHRIQATCLSNRGSGTATQVPNCAATPSK